MLFNVVKMFAVVIQVIVFIGITFMAEHRLVIVLSFVLSELLSSLSGVLSDMSAAVNFTNVPLITDALLHAFQSTLEATLQV